jgi:transposase
MSEAMTPRQERGYQIFKTKKIVPHPKKDGWIVPSQSSGKKYHVDEEFVCDCPDSVGRGVTCKHAFASRYYLQIEQDTPEGTETTKVRLTYPQAWKAYTAAQTSEVRLFDELLKDLVSEYDQPIAKRGRGRPETPLNTSLYCAIQKVYSQLSSRRAASLFKNSEEREQIKRAPNYNVVNIFLNREDITPILEDLVTITARPLQSVETEFAVDSSGFRTTGFTEYCHQKHGGGKPYKWLKAHICVGVKTNIITAVNVTPGYSADSPEFDPLVTRTAEDGFTTNEVSADMAYSSRDNLALVDELEGVAYIPFKSGSTGRSKGSPIWKKMFRYFQYHEDEFLEHYHKRSNVETTFAMIKMKLGDKLKSKKWISQKNELLCKIIAHNIVVLIHEMFELGIEPNFNL